MIRGTELTNDNLQVNRDATLGLVVLLLITAVLNVQVDTDDGVFLAVGNMVSAALLSTILVLPTRWRLAGHMAAMLLYSFIQVSIDGLQEPEGHLLFILTILLWRQYGIPRGRGVLVLLAVAVVWLTAVALSVAGYIYQTPPPNVTINARGLIALRHIAVYLCVTWQLWVVVIRPSKRLRDQDDRQITHLQEIERRYHHLLAKRIVQTHRAPTEHQRAFDIADKSHAKHHSAYSAFGIAMELLAEGAREGSMTSEGLSFLYRVLKECTQEHGHMLARMDAAIARAERLMGVADEYRAKSQLLD